MSEQSEAIVSVTPSSTVQSSGPLDGVRQLACAWVGLWSVASEDLGTFYQRCVARGEQVLNGRAPAARKEMKPPLPDAVMSQPTTAAARAIRPMSVFNAFGAVKSYHIDLSLDALLPTKEEVSALSERVDVLAREIEALMEQRQA